MSDVDDLFIDDGSLQDAPELENASLFSSEVLGADDTAEEMISSSQLAPASQSTGNSSTESAKKSGFHDDNVNNTFGYYRKGVYQPQSNFGFEFVAEVVCECYPQSSGFLMRVKAEGSNTTRECYSTNDSVNNKRSEFMRVLNWSYRVGCLQCSFSDKEMNEYIQLKKRSITLSKKSAVQTVGKQPDGTWILGGGICISSSGTQISESESAHVWISGVFSGPGIPSPSMECHVSLPLTTAPLRPLLNTLAERLGHNFYPALLLLGSATLVLHYQEFIAKLRYCPIPLAFGASGTGKTTAIECAMGLLGARESRLYSKVTREKIFDMCCDSAGIPLGVDDPHSKSDINKLLVELYNGKKGATMGKGERCPSSTAIIAANFSPADQERYASRCLMIPFKLPQLSMSLSEYMEIVALQTKAGSCVGYCIELGSEFFSTGVSDVDKELLPMLIEKAGDNVNPRVIPSYAMLLWFSLKLVQEAGLGGDHREALIDHVLTDVLTTASSLQPPRALETSQETQQFANQQILTSFATELIQKISNAPKEEVLTFVQPSTTFQKKRAIGVKLERVPNFSVVNKHNITSAIRSDSSLGALNVPRNFMQGHTAQDGKASFKQEKCAVICMDAFTQEIRDLLLTSMGCNPDSGKWKNSPTLNPPPPAGDISMDETQPAVVQTADSLHPPSVTTPSTNVEEPNTIQSPVDLTQPPTPPAVVLEATQPPVANSTPVVNPTPPTVMETPQPSVVNQTSTGTPQSPAATPETSSLQPSPVVNPTPPTVVENQDQPPAMDPTPSTLVDTAAAMNHLQSSVVNQTPLAVAETPLSTEEQSTTPTAGQSPIANRTCRRKQDPLADQMSHYYTPASTKHLCQRPQYY